MIEVELVGLERFAGKTRELQRRLMKTVGNSFRNRVRRTITTVKRDIRTGSGIGRSIWGKKASGLNPLVSLIRTRFTPEGLETGIKFKGLAKLIEQGGHTKPPREPIRPGPGKTVLAFQAGGKLVFARYVSNHPGAPVRAHGFGATAIQRDAPAIAQGANDDIGKLIAEVFSGQ